MSPRQAVSTREWIDATGTEVSEEQATGFRYTLLDQKQAPIVVQLAELPQAARDMLAIRGGATLCGNIVSGAKTQEGDPLDLIRARFALLKGETTGEPTWVSREGAVGPRYDLDVLAQAIASVAGNGADPAAFRAKMGAAGDAEISYTDPDSGRTLKAKYVVAAMRRDDVSKAYYALKPQKRAAAPALD